MRSTQMKLAPQGYLSAMMAVFLLCGCGNGLTRGNAKSLIAAELDKKPVSDLPLSAAFLDCAVGLGVFQKRNAAGFDFWQLAPAGKTIATDGGGHFIRGGGEIKLLKPVRRVVTEITGIAEVAETSTYRTVNFRWKYEDIPEQLEPCAQKNSFAATAIFQKYDDGWRLGDPGDVMSSL